jgi:hypothetical protein
MRRSTLVLLLCLAAAPGVATAQHHQNYAGLQARAIKALSDQQIADLRAGRGMGLALAAELNGFPGPLHVWNSGVSSASAPTSVRGWRGRLRR